MAASVPPLLSNNKEIMISRRNLLLATAASGVALPSFAAGKTYTAGKEYLVLEPSVPTDSDKIEVVKFFAYTCSHCLAFEPIFNEWKSKLPSDVVVRVCPVAWSEKFLPFTQTYFALEAMGLLEKLHNPFFESVIYQTYTYDFENAFADISAFMAEQGVDVKPWERSMRSFGVQNKARIATQLWQAYRIDSTPMIGVAGRFTTGPHLVGTRNATPDCLNFLIEEARRLRG